MVQCFVIHQSKGFGTPANLPARNLNQLKYAAVLTGAADACEHAESIFLGGADGNNHNYSSSDYLRLPIYAKIFRERNYGGRIKRVKAEVL